jgi:hypothetical protein
MPTLQSHTYRIRTMPPADQKCGKSLPVPTQKEFQNIFSSPSKKIQTPDTQSNSTKTEKRSIDIGLQGRWTRTTGYNSTLAIGGVSCSADSFVVAESSVFRTNFCAKSPAHRQSAKH